MNNDRKHSIDPSWMSFGKDLSAVENEFCSDCFWDYGLKTEAAVLGKGNDAACPRCGSKQGKRLGARDLGELIQRFFVSGSRPGRHLPPILQPGTAGDSDIIFTQHLQHDYALLKDLTGLQLMRNAPALIPMGLSPLRFGLETKLGIHDWADYADSRPVDNLLEPILSYPVDRVLSEGTAVHRIRINPDLPLEASQYDSPPPERTNANRLNRGGFQVFYGALDVETCIFEMKPALEELVNEEMMLASFRLSRNVRMFDFIGFPFDMDVASDPGTVYYFLRSLFFPADHDYRITQELSVRIAALGFDGIVYPSAYSYIREASAFPNVLFFGAPLQSGTLELRSIDKVCFRNVSYSYQFGPALGQ